MELRFGTPAKRNDVTSESLQSPLNRYASDATAVVRCTRYDATPVRRHTLSIVCDLHAARRTRAEKKSRFRSRATCSDRDCFCPRTIRDRGADPVEKHAGPRVLCTRRRECVCLTKTIIIILPPTVALLYCSSYSRRTP